MLLSNPSAGKMRKFEPFVADMVQGRSVLILGSAPTVVEMPAAEMEGYDVIVRVNNFKLFNACRRADIWYTMAGGSILKPLGDLRESGCRLCFLKNPFANVRQLLGGRMMEQDFRQAYVRWRAHWFELPWYIQTVENWYWLAAQIGQVVTTGLSAIVDLHRFKPARMHLAGFDFFSSMKHNIDMPVRLKPWPKHHDFEAEMLFARSFIRRAKNITCDRAMKRIFANPKRFPKIGTKP